MQYHFYDESTGILHGNTLVVNSSKEGHEKMAAANCPPGHKPIAGRFGPTKLKRH